MKRFPSIETHDGRRALAFLATIGGCMVFTAIIIWSLYELRGFAGFIFWLALAAHGQVFLGMAAIGWFAGRRMLASATRDGVTLDDRAHPPAPPPVARVPASEGIAAEGEVFE